MTRKWTMLAVMIAALGTAIASSGIPGHVRVAYPGSMDCQQGCEYVAGGWPFRYLVDNPGISPVGSISLVDGVLGVDIIRMDALAETVVFWIGVWATCVWAVRRVGGSGPAQRT